MFRAYYAVFPHFEGDEWSLWDSRPDPQEPGPPSGRFVKALRTRAAMEAWVRRQLAAGGLPAD